MVPNDPHAELHEQAADAPDHDHPVADQPKETLEEKVDRINRELTKRINDMRTDNTKFKQSVSGSVQALQSDLDTAKTGIANNSDAIETQGELIGTAGKKADAAKQTGEQAKTAAADAAQAAQVAKQSADAANAKAAEVEQNLGSLTGDVRAFETRYERHDHGVTIAMQGDTGGPRDTEGGNA